MPEPYAQLPRPEHPRPDLQRDAWINLNGTWRFTFDPRNIGEQKRWHRIPHPGAGEPQDTAVQIQPVQVDDPFGDSIVVPFPWESRLSSVGEAEYKGAAWYQRVITAPPEWTRRGAAATAGAARSAPGVQSSAGADRGDGEELPVEGAGLPGAEDAAGAAAGEAGRWRLRPVLCFGAVDWRARVWIDGRFAGEHDGGYTPFEIDLSGYLQPGLPATLTVRAWDTCDADTLLGKQTEEWYTHSGGIWQTVWLEGRPTISVRGVRVTADADLGGVTLNVALDAPADLGRTARVRVTSAEGAFSDTAAAAQVDAGGTLSASLLVRIPDARPWSPEDPRLYDATITVDAPGSEPDVVHTYFGLRIVTRARWGDHAYELVLLNGQPVYLRGVLDQALHPDGLHTYPSDDAIRADLAAARELGFNMVRCHIKINDPRYYYWADRLGLLVMYDIPSASLYTPSARRRWEAALRGAIERDGTHPSIFAWILFNETWGLEEHQTPASWAWVRDMFALAKSLDPTRLAEDNSACLYDHVVTDLNTWHFYITSYDRARRHVERVVDQTYEGSPFNYVGRRYAHVRGSDAYRQGGEPLLNSEYAGLGASGGDKDISYSFKFLTSELRRHARVCGYVYTELSDIEWEHNGLLNYDRTRKEMGYDGFVPEMVVADLNGADFVGLDCPPCQTLAPGGLFRAPAFVAHWDCRRMETAVLRWHVTAIDRFGRSHAVAEGQREVRPRQYDVVDGGSVEAALPDEPCLVTVALSLEDAEGNVRARNYVNVDVFGGSPAPRTERTPAGWAVRFSPADFDDASWPTPMIGPGGAKFGAAGAGWVEYRIALPAEARAHGIRRLRLLFEAGARTASQRMGWKRTWRTSVGSYPQTEARKLPSDVETSINGVQIGALRLADDPADARGVLSLHLCENFEFASYGFLTELTVEGEQAVTLLDRCDGDVVTIRFEVPGRSSATTPGGLNLYGARLGAYPLDPTLFLE